MMDKLFDGSDAHLLPGNAELIQRLREYHNTDLDYGGFGVQEAVDAANALEAADKRIAELEAINGLQAQSIGILAKELDEAERKLAVALEALRELACLGNGSRYGNSIGNNMAMKALAQIGGDE